MSWHGKNAVDLLETCYWQGAGSYFLTVPPGMKSGEMAWADILVATREVDAGKDIVAIWFLEKYLECYRDQGNVGDYASAFWATGNYGFKSLNQSANDKRAFFHRDKLVKPDSQRENILLSIRYAFAVNHFDRPEIWEEYAEFGDYLRSQEFRKTVEYEFHNNVKNWHFQVGVNIRKLAFLPISLSK